jgi:D-alanyl-D-alanine carboxypeptidase
MHSTPLSPSRRVRRARALAIVTVTVLAATAATYLVLSQRDAAQSTTAPHLDSSVGQLSVDDGFIEEGAWISPFADELPAIAKLDPTLRDAMQAAATAALADGFEFVVTSGWRSERYQQALFDEAVLEYGSTEEASRMVATSTASAHVTGEAVDIGFTDANSWLSQHGADYGLCQIYANEMWHFELATTPGGECPPQLPDASHG